MTHAAAIGYDWFYPELSAADRELIRQAIITKGLDAALPIYEKQEWWTKVTHNWNLVCNGGIGLGALAIAGDDTLATEKANAVLKYALASVPLAFASYAPDGGWAEGPGYWGYATSYAVYFLAGLDSALGTDFGLSRSPGFERAGIFRLYFTGPTQQTFNYADAHSDASSSPTLFWLARRFHQPQDAWQEQQLLRLTNSHSALDLLWYEPSAAPPDAAHLPLDAMFTGVNVGFLRTSWTNPDAMWVAAKGGRQSRESQSSGFRFVCLRSGWSAVGRGSRLRLLQLTRLLRQTAIQLLPAAHRIAQHDPGKWREPKRAGRRENDERRRSTRHRSSRCVSRCVEWLDAAYPSRTQQHAAHCG